MTKADPNLTSSDNACLDFRLASTDGVNASITAQDGNMIRQRMLSQKKNWRWYIVLDCQILEKPGEVKTW
jgi:hypothetical protein